jgi:iron-sulfur cluster assembly protein
VLVLTQNAVEAIHAIKASSNDVPDDAGLRISAEPGEEEGGSALQLAIVSTPDQSDVVVETAGEQVFLEEDVATYLEDKILDAEIAEGRVSFAIAAQPGANSGPPDF